MSPRRAGTDLIRRATRLRDLPQHLERLGTTHLVIAGMTANLCCESTGRHAMERGYDVTYVADAIPKIVVGKMPWETPGGGPTAVTRTETV